MDLEIDHFVDEDGNVARLKDTSAREEVGKRVTAPLIAEVGQYLRVLSVDENGFPTSWETARAVAYTDTVIMDVTLEEEVSKVTGPTLTYNEAKEILRNCDAVYLYAELTAPTDQSARGYLSFGFEVADVGGYLLRHDANHMYTTNLVPSSAATSTPHKIYGMYSFHEQCDAAGVRFGACHYINSANDSGGGAAGKTSVGKFGCDSWGRSVYGAAKTDTAFGVGSRFRIVARRYNR